jgi:CHAD domain-containing protein
MAKAKEISGLDYGAGAGTGIRLILRSRFEEMRSFRDVALDRGSIKGVHDMRVASRRLRSALRDFMPYLRGRKLRRLKKDLKSLADALGAVRDEDVAITALEKLAAEAPQEVAAGIEQLADKRRLKRDIARSELRDALSNDALAKLGEEFNSALEHELKASGQRKTDNDYRNSVDRMSCREAGCEVIAARFHELKGLSRSLYRPHKTRPLHKMRIAAKRLRYAIELFAPGWIEPLASFAKEIARLQTSLGELHDCDVWIKEISLTLRETERESTTGEDTPGEGKIGGASSPDDINSNDAQGRDRSAAVWLLAHFVRERASHFRDALLRWHEWETGGFNARLAATLHNEMSAVEAAPAALTPAETVAADIEPHENS